MTTGMGVRKKEGKKERKKEGKKERKKERKKEGKKERKKEGMSTFQMSHDVICADDDDDDVCVCVCVCVQDKTVGLPIHFLSRDCLQLRW